MEEGLLFQSQSVHDQQPQWVPMTHIGEPPVAQAQRLDVLTAPQSPTEMLPALPQPRRSLAPCTTSKAMPLSGPMPNRMPQSPARPSGPAPGTQPQQQPVQEGPGQPQVFSHFPEALGQGQQQQTALCQQQNTLQQQAVTLQQCAMKEMKDLQQEHVYKKRKLHHMPQQQVALKEQKPMATHVDKAVLQVLPTIPLPGRLEAMWSEGQDASSASAAAVAYSASAAAAGASGGAASERASASCGTGPTATLWSPRRCLWQSPEELSAIMDDWVVAMGAVSLFGDHWRILEAHKAHC